MKRTALSRRTMLRGALATGGAVAVGLPLLEAMMNSHGEALADGTPFPVRFVTWFFGNGVVPGKFYPTNPSGPVWDLSEELAPLANVKPWVSVFQGFNNKCENAITHHEGMTVFSGYTFVQPPNDPTNTGGFYSKAGGPTVDQVVGDLLMGQTTIHSLQLGCSKRMSIMDSGTTMHAMSHRGTHQPLYAERNPLTVYNQVFGSFTPQDDPNKPVRLAVLSSVREDVAKLKQRLGSFDNQRLEAHLEGISALEAKINALPPLCSKPGVPVETNVDINGVEPIINVNKVMSELLAYAFTCDITRVASYLMIGGAAETSFPEGGMNSGHHNNSHANNNAYHNGVIFIMQRLAYLLELFANTDDGNTGKKLIENVSLFASSDCCEGWTHSVANQPMLIAGGGGGRLVPGQYVRSANGRNATDVTLAAARAVVPELLQIGSGNPASSTPVTEVLQGI